MHSFGELYKLGWRLVMVTIPSGMQTKNADNNFPRMSVLVAWKGTMLLEYSAHRSLHAMQTWCFSKPSAQERTLAANHVGYDVYPVSCPQTLHVRRRQGLCNLEYSSIFLPLKTSKSTAAKHRGPWETVEWAIYVLQGRLMLLDWASEWSKIRPCIPFWGVDLTDVYLTTTYWSRFE